MVYLKMHGFFMSSALPHRFRVSENPCNPQCLGTYKFPEQGNSLWKAISFSGCKFLRKIELIRKPQQSQEHESIKISYYGYIIGKITLLHTMHCVKSVRIRSYSGLHFSRIFPHSDWIRRDTEYIRRALTKKYWVWQPTQFQDMGN